MDSQRDAGEQLELHNTTFSRPLPAHESEPAYEKENESAV